MNKIIKVLILLILVVATDSYGQVALTNSGASIEVFGSAVPSNHGDLVIIGDFENQTDLVGNDGEVDLADNANIFVNGSWLNNSFSNVFSPTSSSIIDGVVVFNNQNTNQVIGGLSPTYFENVRFEGSRKILSNTDNSVNNIILLNSVLDLNSNTFEIKNSNPMAISYVSGFIKSETLPGSIGYLKWNTANTAANFSVPFGSDGTTQSADLRMELNIKSSMSASDYFLFATYPTDMYNQPLPDASSPLETEAKKVVDRFWLLEPSDKNNLPFIDIVFTYTSDDVSDSKNSIDPNKLLAIRNNTDLGTWLDVDAMGQSYLNKVEVSNISSSQFYSNWTLINEPPVLADVFVPTAFTPNGDGLNDDFFPVFQTDFVVVGYECFIFNKWGRVVFNTTDQTIGWDGSIEGYSSKPIGGVYSWVVIVKGKPINAPGADGFEKKYTGKVTLLL